MVGVPPKLYMESILITGNMGYIGPCVAAYFRACRPAAKLIGLDTGFFASNLLDTSVLPECVLDAQWFNDVRQISTRSLAGIDTVVHLAAISNDPMGNAYERVTEEINYQGTIAVARAARQAGVRRFVFASSCSVYGFAEDGARTETSEVNPLTAYARSKVASEQALAELASPGFLVTCLRFATACGASPRLRLDLVLNDFVASALATGVIRILSDGTPWRPLIAVDDMARAIDWGATRTASEGGEYLVVNAGSNAWNYQIRELAEAVAQAIPGTTVDINRNAAPDKRSYKVDFTRFASLAPRHQPRVTLPGAIAELEQLLRSAGFADANFRQSRYMRLNMLSQLVSSGRLNSNLEWLPRAMPAAV
jgi:nucleoside-diphosphate-sugar epimerase